MSRVWTATAAVGVLGLAVQAASAADLFDTTSRPLPAVEIGALYAGQTWHWESGAGYFGPAGDFRAWSTDESGTPGYGTGEWTATDAGRLCFDATWRYGGDQVEVSECFAHRRADGVIYQRVEPAGDWYRFRSSPPEPGDEVTRITAGDDVTARIEEIRAQ